MLPSFERGYYSNNFLYLKYKNLNTKIKLSLIMKQRDKTLIGGLALFDIAIALLVLPDPSQTTTVVGSIALVVSAIMDTQHTIHNS